MEISIESLLNGLFIIAMFAISSYYRQKPYIKRERELKINIEKLRRNGL